MNEFVKIWKAEHKSILRVMDEAYHHDIYSALGQTKLFELKRLLSVHLHTENENLYPCLRKAAETDAALRRLLFLFAADMDKISDAVLEYFKELEKDPHGKDLLAGFGKISSMLKSRISREENLLLKEYEKLQV